MTSDEFIHEANGWAGRPDGKFAELIGSSVRIRGPHQTLENAEIHGDLCGWLGTYCRRTPGLRMGVNSTWIMSEEDAPQPHLSVRIVAGPGGRSTTLRESYAVGVPELAIDVGEFDDSTIYRKHGVREYPSIIVAKKEVHWRELVDDRYRHIAPDADGLLRSRIFPGLWLDPAAIWDPFLNIGAAVDLGLATPEHSAFLAYIAHLTDPAASRR